MAIDILFNNVLIEPLPKYTHYKGLEISAFVDPQNHMPNFGTVKKVPEQLLFYPKSVRRRTASNQGSIVRKTISSLEYDAPMEVKVGDLVLFRYVSLINKDLYIQGDILIPYDHLYCKVEGDKLTMLNDWVLIRPQVVESTVIPRKMLMPLKGRGEVVAVPESKKAKYRDYPMMQSSRPKVGTQVFYYYKRSSKVEYNMHQTLNTEGKNSLVRVRSKDICAYIN